MDSSNFPLQVGVKAFLKNPEGKFLLVRRNPAKYPDVPQAWDIVGGRIDTDFPLIENLKREIKEEVSLELIKVPKLIAAQDIMRPDKHVVRLTYVGEIEGEPVIDQDHTEAQWFTMEEIKAMSASGEIDAFFQELLEKGLMS